MRILRVLARSVRGLLAAACAAASLSAPAHAETTYELSIPATTAREALGDLAVQTETPLLFAYDDVRDIRANAVEGVHSLEDALALMLEGTPLTAEVNADGVIVVSFRPEPSDGPASALAPEPAAAPAAPAPPPPDVITVTALRRSSELRGTPVAVTAFDQAALDTAHADDLAGLQMLVPNLTVEPHGDSGGVHVYLRGVGSANHSELGDPAVSFHIDEVYSPRPQGATALMYDVERVEVLRGPQGTLFGRNATAGVVNVVTAKPSLEGYSAHGAVTAGSFGHVGVEGRVNAPLTERFALRAAAIYDSVDGWVEFQDRSAALGAGKYGKSERVGARLSGLYAREGLRVLGQIEHFGEHGAGNVQLMQRPRPGEELRSALIDSAGALDQSNVSLRGRVTVEPNDSVTLSYLGGWARMQRTNVNDGDGGGRLDYFAEHRTDHARFDSFSHELQAASTGEGPFEWVLGAYWLAEDNAIRFDVDRMSDASVDPDGSGPIVIDARAPDDERWSSLFIQPERTLDSKAAFGQATVRLTERARLTGGLRYTRDEKADVGGRNWVCPGPDATVGEGGRLIGPGREVTPEICGGAPRANDGRVRDAAWTWLVRGELDLAEDLFGYASVSRGFKSGGLSDGGVRHEPEHLTSYELGLKASLPGRLHLNTAAFHMAYEDMQVASVVTLPDGRAEFRTSNAARASISGVETEFNWRPGANWTVFGYASWLDAAYDRFLTVDSAFFDPEDPANFVDIAGNALRNAPEWSLTVGVERAFQTRGGDLIPRVLLYSQSRSFLSELNDAPGPDVVPGSFVDARSQDAYATLDASLRFVSDRGWTLEVFGQNLTDEAVKYDAQWNPDTRQWMAFYNEPRRVGVRLAVALSDE